MWVHIIGYTLTAIAALVLGFFIARMTMMSYLKKNPPINEQMLRIMMQQMGQNPSQKKLNQMMKAMERQYSK